MDERQKRKLDSILTTPTEVYKSEKIDSNADPFKAINNRYKTITDTYRNTERTAASLNESLTDIYSPSYFKTLANSTHVKLKPLDFSNVHDTTITFQSKDDLD